MSPFDHLDPSAQRTTADAVGQMRLRGADRVGTEHLLLALLLDADGLGSAVLAPVASHHAVWRRLDTAATPNPADEPFAGHHAVPGYTDPARRVVEEAVAHARARGDDRAGVGDLLLTLLAGQDHAATATLADLGVDLDEARRTATGLADLPAQRPLPDRAHRDDRARERASRTEWYLGRYDEHAVDVAGLARDLARAHNRTPGTEHLLLALVEKDAVTAHALDATGSSAADAARLLSRMRGADDEPSDRLHALTSPARRALEAAVRLAHRHGDESAEPVHVLAALLATEGHLAAVVLETSGVDVRVAGDLCRGRLSARSGGGEPAPPIPTADPAPALPGGSPLVSALGAPTRAVLARAGAGAARRGRADVGTVDLLLALLDEDPDRDVAAAVLDAVGARRDVLARHVGAFDAAGREAPTPDMVHTAPARRALEGAVTEAEVLGHDTATTAHLLLAVLAERSRVTDAVLAALDVDPAGLRDQVLAQLTGPAHDMGGDDQGRGAGT